MKIGILTFHRANNLGAVLQASALLKKISETYSDCEIIDFYPNSSCPRSRSLAYKGLRIAKYVVTLPFILKQNIRSKRFNLYRKQYYILSKKSYYGDENIKECHFYDLLISGSDQILNTTLSGKTTAYYLDFDNKATKISYASSFGRENISNDEIELIKSELPKFSCLSVREQSAADIIFKETGIQASLVLDPVFLLTADEWKLRCNNKIKLPKKYIFVYSMEVSECLEISVKRISEEYNLPVIVVRGGGKPGRIKGKEDSTCGPAEFLRYIRDAELVITNSFHGTAFSIIFKKKFLCIAHSTRNARLDNLLALTKNNNKILSASTTYIRSTDYVIDGEISYKRLTDIIVYSKNYLMQSLQGGFENEGDMRIS